MTYTEALKEYKEAKANYTKCFYSKSETAYQVALKRFNKAKKALRECK